MDRAVRYQTLVDYMEPEVKYDELKKASYRLKELVRFSIICAGFLSKEILKIKIKLYTIRKYKNIFREKGIIL